MSRMTQGESQRGALQKAGGDLGRGEAAHSGEHEERRWGAAESGVRQRGDAGACLLVFSFCLEHPCLADSVVPVSRCVRPCWFYREEAPVNRR